MFYFEAEERVDFRDLVRKLAAHFHVRIDMRQIGVRDEARIVGGLGHCGQELCCKRMGGDFNPCFHPHGQGAGSLPQPSEDLGFVRQAHVLPALRVRCVQGLQVACAEGQRHRADAGRVRRRWSDLDVPREIVSLKVGDEKPVRVPLSSFDAPVEGGRPTSVSADAWDEACLETTDGASGEAATFLTSQFTGSDKLAEAGAVHRTSAGKSRRGEPLAGSAYEDAIRSRQGPRIFV